MKNPSKPKGRNGAFNRHRVELAASLGYPFVRAFFELDLTGDDLDPGRVTKLLRNQPTESCRKGEPHPTRKLVYSTGSWTLSSGEVRLDTGNGEDELTRWLKTLEGARRGLQVLRKRHQVTLRIVLYAQAFNSEFYLSPEAMARLAKLGIRVLIDRIHWQ